MPSARCGVPLWALAAVTFLSGTAAALRRPVAGVFPALLTKKSTLKALGLASDEHASHSGSRNAPR